MKTKSKIITGDCQEEIADIGSETVDLVLTSPPYDDLRDYEGYDFEFEGLADELYRVLKDGGVCVWVVGDATKDFDESCNSFRQALYFHDSVGFKLLDTMIYHKKQGPPIYPNCRRYRQSFEYMFVFVKGKKPKTFNPVKKPRKTQKNGYSKFRQKDGSFKRKEIDTTNKTEKRVSNLWSLNCGKGHSATDDYAHQHPAIFPEELAKRHINTWSNKGDMVLDPLCGSGTTCKVAKKLDRNFICIDSSSKYTNIAERRVEEVVG